MVVLDHHRSDRLSRCRQAILKFWSRYRVIFFGVLGSRTRHGLLAR